MAAAAANVLAMPDPTEESANRIPTSCEWKMGSINPGRTGPIWAFSLRQLWQEVDSGGTFIFVASGFCSICILCLKTVLRSVPLEESLS